LDVDSLTRIDTCVCLLRGENAEAAEVTVSVSDPSLKIKRIDIVCEARLIELFEKDGQYLSSHSSIFIDDHEGIAVNNCKIIMNTALSGLTLRVSTYSWVTAHCPKTKMEGS